MSRHESNWTFARQPAARREPSQSWGKFWLRIAILVVFGVLIGAGLMGKLHAGEVRAAVVNDPASARSADVKPLIRDDLQVYLNGGTAALGWSMHRVTAPKLAEAFRTNEVAAVRLYGDGSDIVISGTVRSVSVTINTPTVNLGMVPAMMRPGHDAWLASLKPGDRVEVACRRVRGVLTLVGAFECEPRAAYVARMVDAYFFSMHGLAKGGDKMAAKLLEIASK